LATSYSEAGMACRDFIASYMHGESQDWLEGAACRTTSGAWEVRRLKPLKSS
jgi:surface antigen